MTIIHAAQALLPEGWASEIRVAIAPDGRLAEAPAGAAPDHRTGLLLPAPGNLHSHAFQRAMAGLAERRGGAGQDSFWTWRQLMYRFLEALGPDEVEAIAAQVQMEMLEAGFAAVGEVHYLHHQPGGAPSPRLSELADRIVAAAAETGIGLTLLPVLYSQGGCDGRPLGDGQRRFGNDTDRFSRLVEGAAGAMTTLGPDAVLGLAPHSLRAVSPDALAQIAEVGLGPLHMHLAEQEGEVSEAMSALGARPVEWLLDNAEVDARWCLIHCTQMRPHETARLARTGAVAGLCPVTEANLGDGIFDGAGWRAAGGRFGVGSDSNLRISLSGELSALEYSQRLRDRARAVLADPGQSTGRQLLEAAATGAAQALGRGRGAIAPGEWADLVALDTEATALVGRNGDTALDTWIFAAGDGLVRDVWSAGRHVVRDGAHVARSRIEARFREAMVRLGDAL
ncbi:formimidoylglutamate deiminase [Rhodosalinus sp. FB01]|uniref:formimidoylglutamate deiminase n=1 Tax=Rhodosalinus sp. FB01 TaxID=3239194 RepID=UPI00352470B0